ncbi:MAG: hypothetical protein M1828_002279 [Chrysothrix sp. TS-e1954]|nr:MAG: hypothetical protein M1828_002279 [Chrysothrix sp. TS-e1954]
MDSTGESPDDVGTAMASRLSDFVHWFQLHGGHVHDSVEFVHSLDKGVHMRVKKNCSASDLTSAGRLPKGTCAISCPHALTYSALNALRDSDCLPRSEDPTKEIGNRHLALPQDLLGKARPQFVAAFGFAIQWLSGGASPWYPYLQMLPLPPSAACVSPNCYTHPSCDEIDSPLWWSDEERAWLSGTSLEKGVIDLEAFWLQQWNEWQGLMVPWAKHHGVELTWCVSSSPSPVFWSWQHYKYALAILSSRAFQSSQLHQSYADDYDPDAVLYPGLDLLNHSPATRNRWESDASSFWIVCDDEPLPGDEIYNFYGAKNNAQLLLAMGFVPEELNPQDTFALKLKVPTDIHAPEPVVVAPYDAARSVEPSRLVQSADPTDSTYFIKRPLTADQLQEHRERGNHDVYNNVNHPDYVADIGSGLTGMPYSMIRVFAGLLGQSHGERHDRHDFGPFSALARFQVSDDRLSFAIVNLLLQRLHFEIARLQKHNLKRSLDEISPPSSRRLRYTEQFRQSQIDLLQANAKALSQRIEHALAVGKLITIEAAVQCMPDGDKIEFLAGVEIALGSSDLAALRESEEDLWALYLAYNFVPTRQSQGEPWPLEYLSSLYFANTPLKEQDRDDDESEIVEYVLGLYNEIRTERPDSQNWCTAHSSNAESIARCVRAVREVSILLKIDRRMQNSEGADHADHQDHEDILEIIAFSACL